MVKLHDSLTTRAIPERFYDEALYQVSFTFAFTPIMLSPGRFYYDNDIVYIV